jgi:hypothetical protein
LEIGAPVVVRSVDKGSIALFDATGRLLWSRVLQNAMEQLEIEHRPTGPGLYMVQWTSADGRQHSTERLVVQ